MQQSTRSRLLLFWYVTRLFYGLRHFHSVSWICETHADEGRRGRLMLPWLLYQGERCPCYLLYLHLSAYISSSSFSLMCQIHSFDKLSKKGSKKQRGNLLFEVAPEEIGEYRRPTSLKGKRANRLCERGRPTFPASASAPFPLVRLMAREGLPARPCSSCSRMWNRISHLIPRSPWVSCGVDALGGKTFISTSIDLA